MAQAPEWQKRLYERYPTKKITLCRIDKNFMPWTVFAPHGYYFAPDETISRARPSVCRVFDSYAEAADYLRHALREGLMVKGRPAAVKGSLAEFKDWIKA
jgi:hypothetical protein